MMKKYQGGECILTWPFQTGLTEFALGLLVIGFHFHAALPLWVCSMLIVIEICVELKESQIYL